MAGRGHFYFITDYSQIEKKVLDALQRESYLYLIIKSLTFFDKHKVPLSKKTEEELESIAHGTNFRYMCLVDPADEHIDSAEIVIFDPNTNTETVTNLRLDFVDGESVFKVVASDIMKRMRDRAKKEKFSIKYQILDSSTAMFMAERVTSEGG